MPPSTTTQQGAGVTVEAVFLGNLPGIGGPWLMQYADFLSHQRGPVGVIHVNERDVRVERVTPRENLPTEFSAPPSDWPASPPTIDTHDQGSIHDCLRALARGEVSMVGHWLIHVRASMTPPAMALVARLSRWTLLCGADAAAVVGAYRLIKQLVEAGRSGRSTKTDRRIDLMVLGSDQQVSQAAARKLNHATANFLKTPIQLRGWRKRMEPVNVQRLGQFTLEQPDAMWPELRSFVEDLQAHGKEIADAAGHASRDTTDHTTEPVPTTRLQGGERPTSNESSQGVSGEDSEEISGDISGGGGGGGLDPVVHRARRAIAGSMQHTRSSARPTPPPRGEAVETVVTPRPLRGDGLASDPMPEHAASGSAERSRDELDLSTFLTGGAVVLQSYCPRYPRTQLAVDQTGRLHLLRRCDPEDVTDDHAGDPVGPRREILGEIRGEIRGAIVELMATRAWVGENIALVRMIERQSRIDEQHEPVLHLFMDKAKPAVGVIHQLGAWVKLHLLREVHVGSQHTWFCTELN